MPAHPPASKTQSTIQNRPRIMLYIGVNEMVSG
jgi:hypothetical protein